MSHEPHAVAPKLVVTLGATAAQSLTGKEVSIGKSRGRELQSSEGSDAIFLALSMYTASMHTWNIPSFHELWHRGNNKEFNMRIFAVTAAALVLSASAAFGQGQPAQSGPENPAVKSTDQNNSSTPVAGANSFTMSQAKSQIEAKGYTHVMHLKKDSSGVWRGTAMKDGQAGPVSVDYQGNVN